MLATVNTAPEPDTVRARLAGSATGFIFDCRIDGSRTRTTFRLNRCVKDHPCRRRDVSGIAGGPELAVEKCIGDAGIRLIHADNNAARGEVSCFGLSPCFSPGTDEVTASVDLLNFDVLPLQDFQQFDRAIGLGGIGRDNVSRRSFQRRLLDGPLALEV